MLITSIDLDKDISLKETTFGYTVKYVLDFKFNESSFVIVTEFDVHSKPFTWFQADLGWFKLLQSTFKSLFFNKMKIKWFNPTGAHLKPFTWLNADLVWFTRQSTCFSTKWRCQLELKILIFNSSNSVIVVPLKLNVNHTSVQFLNY